MAKTETEKEVNDFWQGAGAYNGLTCMSGDDEEAVTRFLERNIVIPSSEPADGEVIEEATPNGIVVKAGSGPEYVSAYIHANPNWLRNRAVNLLNVADYLEGRDAILAAKEAEAKAAWNKRRDELAAEFTAVNSYSGQLPYTQDLINRIIELEGAAK